MCLLRGTNNVFFSEDEVFAWNTWQVLALCWCQRGAPEPGWLRLKEKDICYYTEPTQREEHIGDRLQVMKDLYLAVIGEAPSILRNLSFKVSNDYQAMKRKWLLGNGSSVFALSTKQLISARQQTVFSCAAKHIRRLNSQIRCN